MKKKIKVYLSGPMTGYHMKNYPIFMKAEKILKRKGYTVINPATKPNEILYRDSTVVEWQNYLREDIIEMLKCREVWLLPNWFKSRGSTLEVYIASQIGMHIKGFKTGELNETRSKRRHRKTKV